MCAAEFGGINALTLDQEDFAVDVSGVREVLDFTTVTRVPRTPDFMKGVINLRGSVVPVVDLRLKFGLQETEQTVDTCIIVLEVQLDGDTMVIGAIADSVSEVFELDPAQIEPPPRIGTRFESEFISGMGKHNDDFIIILDVDRVFSSNEMEFFRQAEGSVSGSSSDPHKVPESEEESADLPETDVKVMLEGEADPGEKPSRKSPRKTEAKEKTTGKKNESRKSGTRSKSKETKKTRKGTSG
jgi:purine-binding chemotaxis protein CheW